MRFVAEVSSNHGRDLDRAFAFVDHAAAIGCDAVKFQLFRVRELFAPEVLARSPAHRAREAWELPESFLPPLASRSRQRGLAFGCSVFSCEAVGRAAPHVDYLKVSSYELLWDALLRECAATGLPVMLSTGMACLAEVEHALEVLEKAGCRQLVLFHCVSGYPTPPEQSNLAAIETLARLAERTDAMEVELGWSDHTVEPGVIHRAVHRFGARWVEFHLDLDGRGSEYDAGHCWLPGPAAELIRCVRTGLRADGSGAKHPSPVELPDRDWRADPRDGLRPLAARRAEEVP